MEGNGDGASQTLRKGAGPLSVDTSNKSRRDAILGKVRQGLGATKGDAARQAVIESRLSARQRNTMPGRTKGNADELRTAFIERMEACQASVINIASLGELPEAVTEYLKQHNLPQHVRMGDDEVLAGADWSKTPHLERAKGAAAESDSVGLATAFAGIAETGTIMLTSGMDNPTTNNFLPEDHIVVMPHSRFVGSYEDAWDVLRDGLEVPGTMPRTVNYVSGPSRTGDIEQRLLLGAHGPRRLHVIIVDDI